MKAQQDENKRGDLNGRRSRQNSFTASEYKIEMNKN